uniref:SH3 domain-containing protein n=1 Tax=Thelazia callipaeda TaxID=103827 RepID=A0A158RAW5_THECL
LSRHLGSDQNQVDVCELVQSCDIGATASGIGLGIPGASSNIPGSSLLTIGGQPATFGPNSVANALNPYTAAGVPATNNPLFSASGNGKFAYSTTPGILYDGLLKNYPLPSTLHEQWKTQNQYYTFHPRALRREPSTTEEKPSVLEMEHNYLLKHRVQPWPQAAQNSRARFEHYLRSHTDDRSGRFVANFPARTPNPLSVPVARIRSEEICSTRSEPDLRPMALDDFFSCRWFVALFDYSHHMSPNANAEQEELSFRKHQLIKVFGDVDQDGFYTGQIGHRIGLVPSNMVIEIAKDDLMPPPRRRSDAAAPLEPSLRRMRWGSLKSRSYDHAGDRRPPRYRMLTMESGDQYSSMDRRDHSLPNRPGDYFSPPSFRRNIVGDYGPVSTRSEYAGRGASGDEHDMYLPSNGRHQRDYYGYSREHRSRDTAERDRRDYYVDERDLVERERQELYESEGSRDLRERDLRGGYRDVRENRETRDFRDFRDAKYQREQSLGRRERDYADEHVDHRIRDYRDTREYREPREMGDFRDMRKEREREAEQIAKDPRSYDRRMDYGRLEKAPVPMREYGMPSGGAQPYYPPENIASVEDLRHGRINGDIIVRKFIAKFDYDSRQLSPNVDAEQVELSFHAGDVITVYGEMDEDGFFMGELNGIRGLVPSNFLQASAPNSLMPSHMPSQQLQQQQSSEAVPSITIPVPDQQTKPKGVAFQENSKKPLLGRQSSQISSATKAASQMSMKSKTGATFSSQKSLVKKQAEAGSKSSISPRKPSQPNKKETGSKFKGVFVRYPLHLLILH